MKKSREERQAFFDRIEKKYKEKLLLIDYKRESERLSQKLREFRGVSVEQLQEDDALMIEPSFLKLSSS